MGDGRFFFFSVIIETGFMIEVTCCKYFKRELPEETKGVLRTSFALAK